MCVIQFASFFLTAANECGGFAKKSFINRLKRNEQGRNEKKRKNRNTE